MNLIGNRYTRNHNAITLVEQSKLRESTVAVIGCGGLGGYIIEELCRLGVATLIIADYDRFEVTNLNRQILSTEANIGELKVEAAINRIRAVNSKVKIIPIRQKITEINAPSFLNHAQVICDALDNINTRLELERVGHALNIPLVYSSIAGWFGQVGVSCPGDYSLAKLFSQSKDGIEKIWGNPAFTPAVIASLAVSETVKLLTGRPISLRKCWLQVDLLDMEFERFYL